MGKFVDLPEEGGLKGILKHQLKKLFKNPTRIELNNPKHDKKPTGKADQKKDAPNS